MASGKVGPEKPSEPRSPRSHVPTTKTKENLPTVKRAKEDPAKGRSVDKKTANTTKTPSSGLPGAHHPAQAAPRSEPKNTSTSKAQPSSARDQLARKPISTSPCNICLEFDYASLKRESTQVSGHAPGLEEISRSAASCPGCDVLYRATKHCCPEVFQAAPYYRVFISFFRGDKSQFPNDLLGLSVSPKEFPKTEEDPLRNVKNGWKRRVIHIYSVPGKPCPWPVFSAGTLPSSKPDVLAEQVKVWMAQCEKGHKECKTMTQGVLPRRLVQIVPGSKPGHCKVRLHETAASKRALYVCLSHCWGKHQIITTNGKNFKDHLKEIPWKSLSTTFQDALDFACRIGVEFVWIDSLCIIQDSKSDWEEEAVKMASYYSNADLTIAASAAKDGTVGLFPKKLSADEPMELRGSDKSGRPYHLVTRTVIDHPFDVEEDDLDLFPLTKRGWVYQEHILSRRFLHFGTREVVWECHSSTHCQCGMIPQTPRSDHSTNQVLSAAKYGLETSDVKRRRQLWYENIESMMNLDFTFVSDRLAATAGIVTLLAKGYRGRYLAGLWEDCLIQDLCWVITENGKRSKDLSRIPSWSWGSVSGGFATLWCQSDLSDAEVIMAAHVAKVDCQPDPPPLIGSLTRGALVLEGRTAVVTIVDHEDQGTLKRLLTIKCKNPEAFSEGWFFSPDCQDFTKENTPAAEVHLLKMIQRGAGAQQQSAVFLALQPHKTNKGSFQRVGLLRANIRRRPRQQAANEPFLQRFDKLSQTSKVLVE